MRIYREGNMVFVENLNTNSANNLEQYPLCSLRTALFGDSGFNIINVYNNRLVRTISDYNVSDNTQNIQDKTGTVQADLESALLYLSNVLCFDTAGGGIEARVADLENQLITVTYYDIIDISTTQTGAITQPATGANLVVGAFGFDGNAIESTLTISNKPTFVEAVDNSGNDVIISLQSDWTYSSNILFPDPLALIYQFTIPTKEQSKLDINRVIDYYQNANGFAGGEWINDVFSNPFDGQITFVLSNFPDVETIQFKINGQTQHSIVDYTTSGTIITYLNNGYIISNTDLIEISYQQQ